MAQDPNKPLETQAKRHSPALIGIIVAIFAAIVAFFVFSMNDPEDVADDPVTTTTPVQPDAQAEPAAGTDN